MKKTNILLGSTVGVLSCVMIFLACKKNFKDNPDAGGANSATLAPCSTPGSCGTQTLTGVLGTGPTVRDTIRLQSCTEYTLSGLVWVDSLDVLEIEAGTRILGGAAVGTNPGGGLIITRGAKISATGQASCPIIFTSYRWNNNPQPGDWSGVIILGNAPVNKSNPRIEGVPDNPPAGANYGGTNCNDNSGIFRYVRIEYAGYALATDNEINGLTLGGVGCGTEIDYVEVYKANDDAFEFFGGNVNAKHLVAVDPLDDIYDFDFGYQGHLQFILGLSDTTRADISTSNGIEADNDNALPGGVGSDDNPQTRPVISNLTLIGYPNIAKATAANRGVGNQWRRNAGFVLENSIILGYKSGILLDNCKAQNKYLSTTPVDSLKSNLVHAYNAASAFVVGGASTCSPTPWTSADFLAQATTTGAGCGSDKNVAYINSNANADIKLRNPFNHAGLPGQPAFYQPQTTSPAVSGWANCGLPGLQCVGCNSFFSFTTVAYRGAFGPAAADNWAAGWARF
ncbi:hypothetical protein HHL16_12095 [Pseudoflavitalea sp. G-6-1-2]|uniref:hypothetical protein n=1 Tax=Pseudoflavitalea sp. G-6-1-2 TaxID=2728841 RepID=UPI00146AB944|nr:hypothetical protein [Pseudoflavitalea sp. G-6-1-2]NML21622.1 hypothetical protein [Pseudoflavitalea sp. G-6-1-2]